MKRLLRFIECLTATLLSISLQAAAPSGRFTPVVLPSGQVSSVFAICQDSAGFIWMGTDEGLLRYDGYDFRSYNWQKDDSLSLVNNIVNTLCYDSRRNRLIIGTDKGISEYNPFTDTFSTISGSRGKHVKSVYTQGPLLYAATTTGLYLFEERQARKMLDGHFTIIRELQSGLWAGSYEAIYRYDGKDWHRYDLSGILKTKNILVLDICEDLSTKGALWIGAEDGLYHYLPDKGKCDRVLLKGVPVKTFLPSGDDLWMGTDNGVAVLQEGEEVTFFRHDVKDYNSIPNNVIWALAADNSSNMWLGTDHGAATCDLAQAFRFTGVDKITGGNAGLDIGLMSVGGRSGIWLAGRDGLICSNTSLDKGFHLKADSPSVHGKLSHNKVRDLYDDSSRLWIASDGGLDYYDYARARVYNCHITEPTSTFSSNWMYAIAEDEDHRLWLGTYDGGLFCVNKKKILSGKGNVVCDLHLSTSSVPALQSNIVRALACKDSLLYVVYGNSLDIFTLQGSQIEKKQSLRMPDDTFILTIKKSDGALWIGTDRFLYRLEDDGRPEKVSGFESYMMSLDIYDGKIWVAGKNALASYDPQTCKWQHYPTNGLPLLSICHVSDRVLLGTVDGLLELSADNALSKETSRNPVRITELRINDRVVQPGVKYDGVAILDENANFASTIKLPSKRNSFSISLSAFSYGQSDDTFLYRLKGFDDNWRQLKNSTNKATFINVPSGHYRFEYALLNDTAVQESGMSFIDIDIAKPWYQSTWAYILYILAAAALLLLVYFELSIRHRLKMEHLERQRAIDMANSKTEFLANIAHDFKSPLSIIMGFISGMTQRESDSMKTRELQTVQKNAEIMNRLLHSMAEFNADGSSMLFVPTPVSIPDFARDVWMRYSQVFADKGINCRFVTDDINYLFLIDKVQMESALQNLLSNALKFTPRGGNILMSVSKVDQSSEMVYADIKVEDTGCGIPEDELPKIFNRYYCGESSKRMNPSGTGIGLDIVKQVVELHKGRISVSSTVGKGSVFTIRLSTMKADSFAIKNQTESKASLFSLSQVWRHERKPIILLVEDNADIRDFIIASLGKDYSFLTAEEGKAGLALLKTEKVDLVVTDIAMPGMDGITMARSIRSNLDTTFLPIIILTGKDDQDTRVNTYEYCDAFITKPFDINHLNDNIIRLLIKHEQYLESSRRQKMLSVGTEEVESPDDNFLKEMIRIISEHIDDSEFSASVLHEQSHWSEKQIYRKLKQLTGKTVSEFIRDVRMDKAAAYLIQGKLTIKEVMFKVGYTSQSYFTKCFKERFGILPSEYADSNTGAE